MMSTFLAGSLTFTCSCSSSAAFAMCLNGMWKTFNDFLPVCMKRSVVCPQLDIAPESATMKGKVSWRMHVLVVFIISFSCSLYTLFCLEAYGFLTVIY